MSASPEFQLENAQWCLRFSEVAAAFLESRAQRRWLQRESVGQLFTSDLTQSVVTIVEATLLKPRRASWSGVSFDADEALSQREAMLRKGMYCVGLWHTHPEPTPTPSGTDTRLAADHAQAALQVLNGLVFVIVSNQPFPVGWYVGVHDSNSFLRAK